jgi:hypothetical protein
MNSVDTLEQLAASTLATTHWATALLQGRLGPARPLVEAGPALAETLRALLAVVTPERLARLDPALASIAARTLDQMNDNVRAFLAFAAERHRDDPWHREVTDLLERLGAALDGLFSLIEGRTALVALADPHDRLSYDDVRRELNL